MSITTAEGAGDDWHDIVEQHEPALRRFIGRRMANRHLVDDALQETYLRAIRSPYEPDGKWLRALARRASVDVYRREPPPGPEVDPLSLVAEWAAADNGEVPGSDEHVAALASRQAVRWAFSRLSPRHRRLLVLRGVHELTYDEMARSEGVTPEALTSALNRARERLRAGMQAYERGGLAVFAGLGTRLRMRVARTHAMLGHLPLAELAGTSVAIGLVAVASLAPSGGRATVAAASPPAAATATDGAAAPAPAPAPAALAARPAPGATAPKPGPGTPERPAPAVEAGADVTLAPDESAVDLTVDTADATGPSTTRATVTFKCSRSGLLAPTCPLYREVPSGNR
ncbi:MAG TPA: sigma-70 family RNA polymerase sigma factor [Acidimicrobiales bacterium]|nr:sigma-70 family RNA polymerase sigma factor [Acidimicrobiales bacterium]